MPALLLNRSLCQELLDIKQLLIDLRAGFVAYSKMKERPLRVRSDVAGPGSATVLFPGWVPGYEMYSVKVHAKFSNETPAIKGALHLFDINNGELLAILDSTYLTAARTGVAAALATDELARKDSTSVAIIGAGAQGHWQLKALKETRSIDNVFVFDTVEARAESFAREFSAADLNVTIANGVEQAVGQADIVMAATWSKKPFIENNLVRPGMHFTTLGPDEPSKAELSREVLQDHSFFCDDADLAMAMGALAGVGLGKEAIVSEIGPIFAGDSLGRKSDQQVTIYGAVGLAFQDLVAAALIYQKARKLNLGIEYDFLA